MVDDALISSLGLGYPVTSEVRAGLAAGAARYKMLFDNNALQPGSTYLETLADQKELEIHNYTNICPTNVYEVTPSSGSCSISCQYCLVTDGNQCKPITVYTNYAEILKSSLERNTDKNVFYYFSPKTDAFSEPLLVSGIAHDILRTFIDHNDRHPDTKIRLFICSKAGMKQVNVAHRGDTILSLAGKLAGRAQWNGSIGIMPQYLRNILEPHAGTIADRLEVMQHCQEMGLVSSSVLCQPLLLPYLTPECVEDYISDLADAGVVNIKPEFLTTDLANLSLIAQYINHYDPDRLAEFFRSYLMEENQTHLKQRSRLAPEKSICIEKLALIRDAAQRHGISISICNWVRRELTPKAKWVGAIAKDTGSTANGYACLGYYVRFFGDDAAEPAACEAAE
jgi:DNA repair photolyase